MKKIPDSHRNAYGLATIIVLAVMFNLNDRAGRNWNFTVKTIVGAVTTGLALYIAYKCIEIYYKKKQ